MNNHELYTVYRESRSYGRGDPSDGSEEWETTTSLAIVPIGEDEAYQEHIASEYGDQDYSYRFSSSAICVLSGEEIKQLEQFAKTDGKISLR